MAGVLSSPARTDPRLCRSTSRAICQNASRGLKWPPAPFRGGNGLPRTGATNRIQKASIAQEIVRDRGSRLNGGRPAKSRFRKSRAKGAAASHCAEVERRARYGRPRERILRNAERLLGGQGPAVICCNGNGADLVAKDKEMIPLARRYACSWCPTTRLRGIRVAQPPPRHRSAAIAYLSARACLPADPWQLRLSNRWGQVFPLDSQNSSTVAARL